VLFNTANSNEIPDYIAAAVANPARADTDRQQDAHRQPASVIAFTGMKPGDKVADFMPGRGYFSRIFCEIVGAEGRIYAIAVPKLATAATVHAEDRPSVVPASTCTNIRWSTLLARSFPAPELYNASDDPGAVYEYYAFRLPAESFLAPEPLDVIWIDNYHDLRNARYGRVNMLWVNTALLKALKPGGTLIVEDHAVSACSGARNTQALHRIESAQVKQEVVAAGFEFADESDVLHAPNDTCTSKAQQLHERTDRFLLKFRRP
jgi:predicted methyltransferase